MVNEELITKLIIKANSKGFNLLLMYDEVSFTYIVELLDNYGRLYRITESSDLEIALTEIFKTLI